MKILVTFFVALILLLSIAGRVGRWFGFRYRERPDFSRNLVILASLLLLLSTGWYLFGASQKDATILAGPAIVFLVSLDVFVRSRKKQ